MSFLERKTLYQQLETRRQSRVLVYVTGDRKGWETQIHEEVLDLFINHLDKFGKVPKITLFLYSRGGVTLAAWSLVNLIRQFCHEFEVIVPAKAHSAATLICLGAGRIIMTKQATLGPIDPSVNTPLNPHVPGAPENMTLPVSVEAIKGYFELAKNELGIKSQDGLSALYSALQEKVHPFVLGEVYRARSQIRMLASKLLSRQFTSQTKIKKIVDFLCSESGSHDYTISRIEAKEDLGLNVEKPDDALYGLIKALYDNINAELELTKSYDPIRLLGPNPAAHYAFRRSLVETSDSSDYFVSEGLLSRVQLPGQGIAVNDQRTFEGWRNE